MTGEEITVGMLALGPCSRIYYETIPGRADRHVVVFLHEGLGCTAMWKDFPRRLCRRLGCPGLVYDRTGYGNSSPLQRPRTIHYLHAYALDELTRVIDALIPGSPFFLVGHSDGGSIALIYGADRPPLLKGIVPEAAHVFVEKKTTEGIRNTVEEFEKGRLSALFRYHGEKTRDIFRAWSDTWLSGWFGHWNITDLLPSIEAPVHVVQGREDPYGTPAQVEAIVAGAGGGASFTLLEACGHAPHREHPALVQEILAGFIDRNL